MSDLFKHLDGNNVAELRRWKSTKATTPTGSDIHAGMLPYVNVATGRLETSIDGTNIVSFPTNDDLVGNKPYRGIWDASTGIPTAAGSAVRAGDAIEAGDYWRVSVAGSIVGIIGLDDLEVNDLIYANADAAATAADFWGAQGNMAPQTGGIVGTIVVLASLPANAATSVVPGGGISTINQVQIVDSVGKLVTDAYEVIIRNGTPDITIESLVAQTNLSVHFLGA